MLKIEKKYCGKWIAVKSNKVIESCKTFDGLTRRIEVRKDKKCLRSTFIPNGLIGL